MALRRSGACLDAPTDDFGYRAIHPILNLAERLVILPAIVNLHAQIWAVNHIPCRASIAMCGMPVDLCVSPEITVCDCWRGHRVAKVIPELG
ncbi:hypothetical protein Acr_04g0003640 [Actinidia rufa]|uniref:Uncharacterized protein n=1 Tax=Actinidia rufa TaxID=165716 RepID=A0A7J0EHG6_9ERIC|nr:hypothetical protein Acr_04g0003640 [Actinidia rufa]